MPKETDPARLALMVSLLRDVDPDVVRFTAAAMPLGHRKDEGLISLLPATIPAEEKPDVLKEALAGSLEAGIGPSIEESKGDRDMGFAAATYYHFRLRVEDVPLFVKAMLDEEDDDPILRIISVKRDDRAWK